MNFLKKIFTPKVKETEEDINRAENISEEEVAVLKEYMETHTPADETREYLRNAITTIIVDRFNRNDSIDNAEKVVEISRYMETGNFYKARNQIMARNKALDMIDVAA